ncbi:hypothetical protein IKP85_03400, partial [bacterium]|nr:hypothetical protein [bacterium]
MCDDALKTCINKTDSKAQPHLSQGTKPTFMQRALKLATILALAIGTTSICSDAPVYAAASSINIHETCDVELQISAEQRKYPNILNSTEKTLSQNSKIQSTRVNSLSESPKAANNLRISSSTFAGSENTVGHNEGLMTLEFSPFERVSLVGASREYVDLEVGNGIPKNNIRVVKAPISQFNSKSGLLNKGQITGFATPVDRQVVENGQTVDLIEGSFDNHTDSDIIGGFINNAGTINKVIAEAAGNTINLASGYSGLIYNAATGVINGITGTYINNTIYSAAAGTVHGAAIYNDGGTVAITAADNDVTFTNNSTVNGSDVTYNDIYNIGTINLNAATDKKITFNGAVSGTNGVLVINNDSTVKGGVYQFNGDIDGQIMRIYNGATIRLGSYEQEDGSTTYGVLKLAGFEPSGETVTLDLRNDHIDTHHFGNVLQGASVNHLIDVDLTAKTTDRFTADSTTATTGNILVGAINLLTGSGDDEMIINFSRNSFRFAVSLTGDIMDHITKAAGVTYDVHSVDYDFLSGDLIFNAAEFIPNGGTIDHVYKTSKTYLDLPKGSHATYSSSDIVTVRDDDHPYIVVIGNDVYFFAPHESTDDLNNAIIDLASTGALALKEVVSEEDNYIFEKNGKYYTYSTALLPKSVWEEDTSNSSNYNYYTVGNTGNTYHNISLRTDFLNAIDTTIWTESDAATAAEYTWANNNIPLASNIKPVTDSSGNLISASGMVRFNLPKNGTTTETKYYKYDYTVPNDYTKASSRIETLSDSVTNKYFYNINNTGNGGAVKNTSTTGDYNINADFINNIASKNNGGAIYNESSGKLGYISGTFINNKATQNGSDANTGNGGVLFNNTHGVVKAMVGDFIGNSAGRSGGVVRNISGTIELFNGKFIGNKAGTNGDGWGGVISNKNSDSSIEIILGDFIANSATKGGGAIDMNGSLGTVIGDFIGNSAGNDGGGAIRIDGGFIGAVTGDFVGNSSNKGGAIHFQGTNSKMGTVYGDFIGNRATAGDGGAVKLETGSSVIEGLYGNFINNTASSHGGAIYNTGKINRLSANFIANSANAGSNPRGGAIDNESGAFIAMYADTFGDIKFSNNTAGTSYNDVYNAGTIELNAGDYVEDEVTKQHTITFGGTITGNNNGTININKDSEVNGGRYIFNNSVSSNTINLYNGADIKLGSELQTDGVTTTYGRFSLRGFTNDVNGGVIDAQNGNIDSNSFNTVTLGSNLNLKIDADLAIADKTKRADTFSASSITSGDTKFVVNSILVNADSSTQYTKALVTNNTLKSRFALSSEILDATKGTGVTNEYKAKYNASDGYLIFKNASTNIVDQVRNEYGFYDDIRTYNLTANDDVAADIANYGDSSYSTSSIGALSGTSLTIDGGATTKYGINGGALDGIVVNDGKTLTVKNVGSAVYEKDSSDNNVYTFDAEGKVNNVTINNSIHGFNTLTTVYKESAILINEGANAVIDKAVFYDNYLYDRSGAGVKNKGSITSINADFIGNNGVASTGAGTLRGGALSNSGTIGTVTGNFINNAYSNVSYGTSVGAAIFNNTGSITSISGDFVANRVQNHGGAIYNSAGGSIGSISGRFIKNYAGNGYAKGGAIFSAGSLNSIDAYFDSNYAKSLGGALYIGAESDGSNITVNSINGDFVANSSERGGAIYNSAASGATVTINSVTGNYINNSVTNSGGAIYNNSNSADAITMNLVANTNDMTFYNNRILDSTTSELKSYNDIYNSKSLINLNANTGKTIRFGGNVSGASGKLVLNNDSTIKGGTYLFGGKISGNELYMHNDATVKLGAVEQGLDWLSLTDEQRNGAFDSDVIKAGIDAGTINPSDVSYGSLNLTSLTNDNNGGTIDAQNGHIDSNSIGTVTLGSDLSYKIDVSLADLAADYISASTLTETDNNIVIDNIRIITDGIGRARLTNNRLMDNVVLSDALINADYITSDSGARYKIGTQKVTTGSIGLYLTAGYYRLADAVRSNALSRTYTIPADYLDTNNQELVDRDLGVMGGTYGETSDNASLIIDGGSNKYGINGYDAGTATHYSGIIVQDGQNLTAKNLGSMSGSSVVNSVTGFESENGGFINNSGTTTITNSVFSGNNATANGGVIYNNAGANVILNGTNTFTGNTANSAANDIYNLGTIELSASSTTNIGSGISGSNGSVVMGSGSVLNANGIISGNTISMDNSTVNVGSGKLTLTGLTNTANGGTLNTQNNRVDVNDYSNALGDINLLSDLGYTIDADFANTRADYVSGTLNEYNAGNILINSINMMSEGSGSADIKIGSKDLIGALILNVGDYLTFNNGTYDVRYAVDTKNVTTGSDDEKGVYIATSYYRLSDAVHSSSENRTYTLKPDAGKTYETVYINLGNMGGSTSSTAGAGAKLTVDGGENKYGINVDSKSGIIIQQGQTLELNNIGTYTEVKDSNNKLIDIIFSDTDNSIFGASGSTYLLNNYGTLNLSDVVFANNTYSPLIYNYAGGTMSLDNVVFVNNNTFSPLIHSSDNATYLYSGTIKNNRAYNMLNSSGGLSVGDNSVIIDNYGTNGILNARSINLGSGVVYKNNTSLNAPQILTTSNSGITIGAGSVFDSNYTINSVSGGLINSSGPVSITDSNFTNNASAGTEGPIYNYSAMNIFAKDADVEFSGNKASAVFSYDSGTGHYSLVSGTANDIHNRGTLSLNAGTYLDSGSEIQQRTITISDGITGNNGTLNINSDSTVNGGKVVFDGNISGNTIEVYSGTLDNNATINGNVINRTDATIYSNATNISGTIANAGIVNLEGGIIQGNITKNGTSGGTVKINNTVTLGTGKAISENAIELESGSTLKLHGGTI